MCVCVCVYVQMHWSERARRVTLGQTERNDHYKMTNRLLPGPSVSRIEWVNSMYVCIQCEQCMFNGSMCCVHERFNSNEKHNRGWRLDSHIHIYIHIYYCN